MIRLHKTIPRRARMHVSIVGSPSPRRHLSHNFAQLVVGQCPERSVSSARRRCSHRLSPRLILSPLNMLLYVVRFRTAFELPQKTLARARAHPKMHLVALPGSDDDDDDDL